MNAKTNIKKITQISSATSLNSFPFSSFFPHFQNLAFFLLSLAEITERQRGYAVMEESKWRMAPR